MNSNNDFHVEYRSPSRYTVDEWHYHNRRQYRTTRDRGVCAEKLIEHSGRVQDRVKESILQKKNETEWLFAGRIKDIEFIRNELENVRKLIQEELEALEVLQERIQDEMKCVKGNSGEIVDACIKFREGRAGIDLIHDEVEKELKVEKVKIVEAEKLLDKTLEQTKESKRDLRASIYLLNRDVKNKVACLAIETNCLNLKESDMDLRIYDGNNPLDDSNISVEEWALYSREIIKSSEKKIQVARVFEANVKILLKEIMDDLKEQYQLVNEVFKRRIHEVKEAKAELEEQHCEITKQIGGMSENIKELEKSIQDKQGFLALAQTRLEKRMSRPGIELVKDNVEASLVGEILGIRDSISQLQQLHSKAEKSLRYLLEAQIKLEEEINIKTNTIKIDEVDCLTIRQSIQYHLF